MIRGKKKRKNSQILHNENEKRSRTVGPSFKSGDSNSDDSSDSNYDLGSSKGKDSEIEQRGQIIKDLSSGSKLIRTAAYRKISVEENLGLILSFNQAGINSWIESLSRSGLELALGDIEKALKDKTKEFLASLNQNEFRKFDRLKKNPPVSEYATLFSRFFKPNGDVQTNFKKIADIGSQLTGRISDFNNSSGVGSPGFTKENVDKIAISKTAEETANHIRDKILGGVGNEIRKRIKEPSNDEDYNNAKNDAGELIAKIEFNPVHLMDGEVHAIGLGNDVLAASWIEGKRYARSYDEILTDLKKIAKWAYKQKVDIISYYAGFVNKLPEGINAEDLKSNDGARLREFAAIQIAERGRELKRIEESGKPDMNIVKMALENAKINGFINTYSGRNTDKVAPFAQKGGQKALRDLYAEQLRPTGS